ncbi:MAG: hypothetical protein JXO48_00070 [Deltaproteobacteria bacterium]|nr:hypothetical protein [Deltaproteobacteria bacterium]
MVKQVFLCWPPPEIPMAYRALQFYRDAGGRNIIYVGDPRSSGDEAFHALLDELPLVERRRLCTWPGVEEYLVIRSC